MIKKRVLVTAIVFFPLFALAQVNYKTLLDQYMQGFYKAYDFSGAVLVAKKGKVIYRKGFGKANREWQIANTVDSRFAIASLTKQFTAAAILQLAEKEKLDVQDKLSKYFPDFPKADSISIHMLLNHTSGIKEYSQNSDLFELNPNTPIGALKDTLINTFKYLPFDFSPGTFWKYSNSGYILLGYIIEQVSGKTYQEYIYKNMLQKAGMKNSDLLCHDTIIPYRAEGYTKTPQGWKMAKILPVNTRFSAGGLFSTVVDLYKWNEALYAGKVISRKSLAVMNRPNHGDFGAGYGIFVDQVYNRKALHHQGSVPGYSSFMARYPEDELSIIILTNRDTNLDFLSKGLAAILFDQPVVMPYKHKPALIDTTMLDRYAGAYEGSFPLSIVKKNSKLHLRLHRDIELVPESETKFYIDEPDVDIQIEYVLNDRKEVAAVYYIEGGVKQKVKRR